MNWIKNKHCQELLLNFETEYRPKIYKVNKQYLVGLYDNLGVGHGAMYLRDSVAEAKWLGIKLLNQYEKPVRLVNG